jgi:hypothetical protein
MYEVIRMLHHVIVISTITIKIMTEMAIIETITQGRAITNLARVAAQPRRLMAVSHCPK